MRILANFESRNLCRTLVCRGEYQRRESSFMTLTNHSPKLAFRRIAAAGAAAAMLTVGLAACGSSAEPEAGATSTVVKDDALAALLPADIRDAGTLRVATSDDYPPLEMLADDNKTITGAEPELITAIGEVLGVKAELNKVAFDSLISGIQADRFDIAIQAMLDTAERQEQVTFVDYFNTSTTMLVKSENAKTFTELDTLCGESIAVESGTGQVDIAAEQSQKCTDSGKAAITVLEFPDTVACLQSVVTGRTQAFLGGTPTIAFQADKSDGALVATGTPMNLKPYGILIPKSDEKLAEAVQGALQKLMDEGTYDEILAKYGLQDGSIAEATINGGK